MNYVSLSPQSPHQPSLVPYSHQPPMIPSPQQLSNPLGLLPQQLLCLVLTIVHLTYIALKFGESQSNAISFKVAQVACTHIITIKIMI